MAAGSMMSSIAFANHHEKIPLGIQLWTVKSEAEKDLEGTLRMFTRPVSATSNSRATTARRRRTSPSS
jgi:hypothetical protein